MDSTISFGYSHSHENWQQTCNILVLCGAFNKCVSDELPFVVHKQDTENLVKSPRTSLSYSNISHGLVCIAIIV
jgi:hypothetical protein